MATIAEVNNRIQALNLRAEVPKIIKETSDAIADQQAEQMINGQRSDNKEINPQYSPLTIEIKKSKGQVTDRVTLRDTGSFQNKIAVYVKEDRFDITSTDEKTGQLEKKYGRQIFGLNKQHLEEYGRESFQPALKKYIEQTTGLTMK
ncbi:MAG TPA: hypothetical protein VF487_20300 [Chitinophagaceae bacterium]